MIKILADPGHGGDDNGAAWGDKYDYVEEDDLNLIIGFLLRCELQHHGFAVRLSREKDVAVSLADRCALANDWGADIFISIHADAFHNTTASGISTHIYKHSVNVDTYRLGSIIHESMANRLQGHLNRGVQRSNFHVLRKTAMPAVLVEAEFISNPNTRRFLKEPENQLTIAQAISKGVVKYFQE